MNMSQIQTYVEEWLHILQAWLSSPPFYGQLAMVFVAVLFAYWLVKTLRQQILLVTANDSDVQGVRRYSEALKHIVVTYGDIGMASIYVLFLGVAMEISHTLLQQDGVVRLVQGLAIVRLCYAIITYIVIHPLLKAFFKWSIPPLVILHIMGWLIPFIDYLNNIQLGAGNIQFSLYGLLRAIFLGMVLLWFGRLCNRVGTQFIRQHDDLDVSAREVFIKLFEVILMIVVFFVLLQIIGINLTTLAVFGGAVGVGLGFGLQSIASNFISGIILLLDRSLLVGDYVELEDGRKGVIRQLSMRSATLETFDGKDIVVPNEKFITSSFTNWTHKDFKQRYSIEFQVAYKTDLHALFPLLRDTVAKHPQVISGDDIPIEERPDAEISGFGDHGVNILIEFWMEGVDDGKNRVGADLLLMIWDVLKEHVIEIPYPQRDIRMVKEEG
jgi:small-conductance mechanosensitive channel